MTVDARGRSAAAALRRAAQTDVEVQMMLDQIPRVRRRNRALAGGALLVAGALIVSAGWLVLRPAETTTVNPGAATSASAPSPSPAASFTTTRFEDAFSVVVPQWVTQVGTPIDEVYESPTHAVWNRCSVGSGCVPISGLTWKHCPDGTGCIALSFNLFSKLHVPGDPPSTYEDMPDYAGYVAATQSLAGSGDVTLSDVTTATVGGRPATVMTVTPTKDLEGAVGCYVGSGIGDDCVDLFSEVTTRMAIVDTGATPLVILSRTPTANPDRHEWLAQFDQMLHTVAFL